MMRQTIARAHELHDFGTVQVLEEVLAEFSIKTFKVPEGRD